MTATPSTPPARPAHVQAQPSLGESIIGLGIGCFFSLVMLCISIEIASDVMSELHLLREGEVAEGVVLNRYKERRNTEHGEVDIYGLNYQFTPRPKDKSSPALYRNQAHVDRETHASSPPRSNVLIRYLPASPETNRPDKDQPLFDDLFLLVPVSIVGLFLALQAIESLRSLYHLTLLTWRGRQAMAEVVDRWKEDDGVNTYHCVLYRFATRPSPDGYHYAAENNFWAYQYLNVNDRVKMRYVRNRPDICRLKL